MQLFKVKMVDTAVGYIWADNRKSAIEIADREFNSTVSRIRLATKAEIARYYGA